MRASTLLSAVLLVGFAGSAASADIIAPRPVRATDISVGTSQHTNRTGLIYSATGQSASRFNPGLSVTGQLGATQPDLVLDDVPFNNPGGVFNQVSITQITFGIRQVGSVAAPAPAVDVNFLASTLTTGAATINDALDVPTTTIGFVSLPAVTVAQTTIVTLNFGVPLVVNLNNTLLGAGFGSIALGLQFSGPNAANNATGWRLCQNGADAGFANATQLFWDVDTDGGAPGTLGRGAYSFGVPNGSTVPASTFMMTVTGDLIPSPASFSLLGLAGLVGLRRRR